MDDYEAGGAGEAAKLFAAHRGNGQWNMAQGTAAIARANDIFLVMVGCLFPRAPLGTYMPTIIV